MADNFARSPAARDHFSRGSIAGFLGDASRGAEEFSRCIEIDPKDGYARSLRGYLRGALGQHDAAEADHRAALELAGEIEAPNYEPWALQHYADLHRRRGEFDAALALCARALRLYDYPHVHFRRAWILLDMNRRAEAKAAYAAFERIMRSQGGSYSKFWRDERGAIERLRNLRTDDGGQTTMG